MIDIQCMGCVLSDHELLGHLGGPGGQGPVTTLDKQTFLSQWGPSGAKVSPDIIPS